jgi:hypothetical protein
MGQAIGELMSSCQAILLGRTTYEMFEPAWSTRTAGEGPGAPFMNDTVKFIVSSTLQDATWSNSEIVGPYTLEAIRRVKEGVDGGIYVSGSGTLVRALLTDGCPGWPRCRAGAARVVCDAQHPGVVGQEDPVRHQHSSYQILEISC